jgi:hypothetical protein
MKGRRIVLQKLKTLFETAGNLYKKDGKSRLTICLEIRKQKV